MKGTMTAFSRKSWGFVVGEDGVRYFFHMSNSPGFIPELGVAVEFELAPPFSIGQKEQAVNLKRVEASQKGGQGKVTQ